MIIPRNLPSHIPFVDLITPHVELEQELTSIFRGALHTAAFVGGPMLEQFEKDFAQFCGTEYAIGVSSGTDALRFSIMACGVRPGDVIITVPHTFIATTEAITQAGAVPEFVDIDERSYNMDPVSLRKYLETQCYRTSSGELVSERSGRPVTTVIPVHLYGQVAEMDAILGVAEEYGLTVLEDACQAHGAEYFSRKRNRWMKAGSMGRAAAFSFYPGKNLGACGEAGAITTNDPGVAARIKMLRDHGQAEKYYHEIEGYNGRLDAIQAGLLRVKLPYLPEWNQQRRDNAKTYCELFRCIDDVKTPFESEYSRAVYHLYVIRVPLRQQLRKHLAAAKIGTGIHYPVPLHQQRAYQHLGYQHGDFPATERVTSEILSLPMYPHLGCGEQQYVVQNILQCLSSEHATRLCVRSNSATV